MKQQQALRPRLESEKKRLQRERQGKRGRIDRLVAAIGVSTEPLPSVTGRLTELEGIVTKMESRLSDIDSELSVLDQNRMDLDHVTAALREFDQLWDVMWPEERMRLVRSFVEQIETYSRAEEVEAQIGLNPDRANPLQN